MDEVGLLTVENRYPWARSSTASGSSGLAGPFKRSSWRLKNEVARALVDQDQLADSSFHAFEDLAYACEPSAASQMWSHLHHSKQFFGSSSNLAEDFVSSPSHSLIYSQHKTINSSKSTPAVDFPFQFNFGSIYSSSLTIYFDN